ncbi:MAG: radical SAM protein, partial [Epsilonproteobacteria bacterium]|nr:radical SAM protein [Campylobacterota bacterium]
IRFKKENIWIEITTLLIEGENDSDKDIREMARFIVKETGDETPWHLSAFYPEYKMKEYSSTTLQTLQRAYQIAKSEGLKYVYLGNVPSDNNTYCPNCSALLIERDKYEVITDKITNTKCPYCQTTIKGVWR